MNIYQRNIYIMRYFFMFQVFLLTMAGTAFGQTDTSGNANANKVFFSLHGGITQPVYSAGEQDVLLFNNNDLRPELSGGASLELDVSDYVSFCAGFSYNSFKYINTDTSFRVMANRLWRQTQIFLGPSFVYERPKIRINAIVLPALCLTSEKDHIMATHGISPYEAELAIGMMYGFEVKTRASEDSPIWFIMKGMYQNVRANTRLKYDEEYLGNSENLHFRYWNFQWGVAFQLR